MISFIHAHPWYTLLILWGLATLTFCVLFGWRAWMKRDLPPRFHSGGIVKGPAPDIFPLPRETIIPRQSIRRWPMHNRFMPERTDFPSSERMVQQILGDQAVAHEEPGKPTEAPAPGEEGYVEPTQVITVTVGQYSVHMMRDARPCLGEARPDGAEWPLVEIPEEWAEPLVAFAMEVTRLREGWTVA